MKRISIAVVAAVAVVTTPSGARAQGPDGQALYRRECRSCHGAVGVPPQRLRDTYPRMPTITDSTFLSRRSDDSLVAVMRRGVGRDMGSFSNRLTVDEMRAVAQYIRSLARRRSS
jgi:mono/diheme cytochrome c family protein